MSQTSIWNIVQALSAFKSQRRRDANHEQALGQLRRFPSHLLADCQPKIELTAPERRACDGRGSDRFIPLNPPRLVSTRNLVDVPTQKGSADPRIRKKVADLITSRPAV